ncbi:deoxyribodipyrimidine photo-lyase-like [Zophobas morio]|uniref:deoxyribodipyrimidine photo-lyase-like n=1 Tax=Zophobas morio TaxID=2755281 RepID=UPI003082AF89
MERDQRVGDNHALLYASELSHNYNLPLQVFYFYPNSFRFRTARYELFLLKGLAEVDWRLKQLNIPFHFIRGSLEDEVVNFAQAEKLGCAVVDFSPLKEKREWRLKVSQALSRLNVSLVEVDAHNIVPCWTASDKQEYSARTIRSKLYRHLNEFARELPPISVQAANLYEKVKKKDSINWIEIIESASMDQTVAEVTWALPGEAAAMEALEDFLLKINPRVCYYAGKKNDPNAKVISNLSPYFNFGMLSPLRSLLVAQGAAHLKGRENINAFIEESFVRRELSDNFCYYNHNYDNINGAPSWAQATLRAHQDDKRVKLYSKNQLEKGKTYDDLWNASQLQLVYDGKLHGFLRMYWAKKILEWTTCATEALSIAIYLNDKYNLDGNDPNGYVGCMWSICGVHDQGWKERPVFGKIRYMNYKGCQRKFDVRQFVEQYPEAVEECKNAGGKSCVS